ncbi:hypothetical protein ACHAXT_012724 [Thalassiosira profunda]
MMAADAGATAGVGCAKSAQDVSMMQTPHKTPKKTPKQAGTEHKVPVALRMRPLRPSGGHSGRAWRVDAAGSKILQTNQGGEHRPGMDAYELQHAFDEGASNQDVYDALGQGIVRDVLAGYNGTIFTYGQTSSGKTHTMQGSGECSGLLQLAASDIFSHVEKERASSEAARGVFDLGDEEETSYAVKVSFIEIYNESFRDLLVPADANESARGFRATERVVNRMDELLRALAEGEKNRSVGSTKMNDRSSRSHAIFSIAIESNDATATLNLVDLAGSESVRHTGATGERKKEAGYINQSLLALQRVVTQLGANASAKGRGATHVPYRDSKLTEFLQPSLDGAKLAVICCATPSELHETRSTLQFAARTGRVETKAVKNRVSLVRRWSVAPATPLGTNGRASRASVTTSKKAKRAKVPGILSPKRVWGMLSPPPSKKKARSKTEGRPRAKQSGLFTSIPEDAANDEAVERSLQKDMRIAELEAQLKASREELASAKARVQDETKDMKAEVEWLKAEMDELKTQGARLVADGEFANAETQATLKSAEDELEATKTMLCELRVEADRLRMDNKSAKMKLDGQEVELERLRVGNDELKLQCERLRTDNEATMMKLDGREAEMERLRAEKDELKLQTSTLKASLELANVVSADDQRVPAMVAGRLETEDKRESYDSDATKELAATPEMESYTEHAHERIAKELESIKAESAALKNENARLQCEFDDSRAKISMLEQELIKATAEKDAPDAPMLSENEENEAPNAVGKPSNGKKRTNLGKAFQTMKSPVTRRRGARQRRKTDFLLNSNATAPSASAKAEKKEPESNIVSVQKRKPNKTATKRGTNAKNLAYKTIRVGRVNGYPVVVTQGKSEHEAILLGCDDGDPRQFLAQNADGKVKIKWIIAGYNDKVSPTMVRLHPGE